MSSKPIAMASSPRLTSPSPSRGRASSIARLQSPIPSAAHYGTPPVRQIPTPSQLGEHSPSPSPSSGHNHEHHLNEPLEGVGSKGKMPMPSLGRGESALAIALKQSGSGSPHSSAPSPPQRTLSPISATHGMIPKSNYGSFDQGGSAAPAFVKEDLDIVKLHLAGPLALSSSPGRGRRTSEMAEDREQNSIAPGLNDDEFSSLRLQGGDITRPIYRLVEQQHAEVHGPARRKSFAVDRPPANEDTMNINSIKQPGGFRRDYIRRTGHSPAPSSRIGAGEPNDGANHNPQQVMLTTSFFEFLSLYGHFAGESLEDEYDETDDYFASETAGNDSQDEDDEGGAAGERSALLPTPGKRRRKEVKHGASPGGAFLLLLKSFVGTGVLFLPKAFLNGGMLFSSLILLFVASLSYYCFLLLVSTRLKVPASFGGMGFQLYGKWMRFAINFSLVISQIGFASAYIVFVSENLQAFILAVSKCKTEITIKYLILMQMVIFLPLSLYRNIQNIQKMALIADAFILLGLAYLYYFDIWTLVTQHGVSDIKMFNKNDWTLFIGTAIFTFEGIGLIIPIQESMAKPQKFPTVLAIVMVVITVVFTSMGALSYAAFGSETKTVVILNMPQDSKFVNGVQFIYSLAILLSTPLQFFPAIEITSNAIFKRSPSGRNNPVMKWKKNVYRFFMVCFCALIAWIGADDLDKFVALVGSFACIPLVYIYPPMLHYRAISKTFKARAADIFLIVFGIIVMVYTTSLTVNSWVSGKKEKPSRGYCD